MKAYTVQRNLTHDNQDYKPGRRIDLADDQAEPLVALGVITEGYDGDEKTTQKVAILDQKHVEAGPEDAAVRLVEIKTAISKLNVDNADLWTGAGKPKTEAVQAITGWVVTAKERDTAWDELHPAN